VAKPWQEDSVIPPNVAEAVNYYQPHGLLHGRAQINAADPEKTQILGNYRIDYRKDPIECPEASWYYRVFTPDHAKSECDTRVWTQIEDLVRQRLTSQPVATAADAATYPDEAGSKMLSMSRVVPTNAATATSAPRETSSTGSSVSGSTISK